VTLLWVLRVAIGLYDPDTGWRSALCTAWNAREMRAARYSPPEAIHDIAEWGF
jgi:hypothetical protein